MDMKLSRRRFLGAAAAGAAASAMPFGSFRAMAASPFAMQASWINDAEFAGYFLGLDKGYYADEGLDMSYASGGRMSFPKAQSSPGVPI